MPGGPHASGFKDTVNELLSLDISSTMIVGDRKSASFINIEPLKDKRYRAMPNYSYSPMLITIRR